METSQPMKKIKPPPSPLRQRVIRIFITVVLCSATIGAGVVIAVVGGSIRSASKSVQADDQRDVERAPNVQIRELEYATIEDRITLTGGLEPWETRMVSAEVGGRMEWHGVEEGDYVTEGMPLFRVDTEAIRRRLDQQQAEYRLAAQERERLEELVAAGISSRQELDRTRAEYDVRRAAVRSTELDLDKSVVKAPFDGVVDRVERKTGEFVDVGAPLARLVQVDRVKVTVGVPERDVVHFSPGDTVSVRIDAFGGETFEAGLHRIATTADPDTRTFRTELVIENPDNRLRPGMIARANMVRETHPGSILVPIFSVISLEDRRYVFVVEDGRAILRDVKAGVVQGDHVQITEGLEPGDQLIVVGQRDLRPGEPVNVLASES